MRSGRCSLGSSISTCRLVIKNSRESRSKKKALALVNARCCSKVKTRVAARRRESISGVVEPIPMLHSRIEFLRWDPQIHELAKVAVGRIRHDQAVRALARFTARRARGDR